MLIDAIGGAQPNISPSSIERREVYIIENKEKLLAISKQLNLLLRLESELTNKLENLNAIKTSLLI